MDKLNKLKKFAEGGSIRKYGGGDQIVQQEDTSGELKLIPLGDSGTDYIRRITNTREIGAQMGNSITKGFGVDLDQTTGHQWTDTEGNVHGLSATGEKGLGIGASAAVKGVEMLDNALMGDKNFGAQSAAIDSAVHGVSGALMKSGNPYAMAAGAALEGANFLTKAGGQTVQGFDVNINNAGYGNLGHMESSSSRDFGAIIGLGGLNSKSMERKLAKRNEQAQMALSAAEVSEDTVFEQESRSNSKNNVLRLNQVALAGGIDPSLLAN